MTKRKKITTFQSFTVGVEGTEIPEEVNIRVRPVNEEAAGEEEELSDDEERMDSSQHDHEAEDNPGGADNPEGDAPMRQEDVDGPVHQENA